ncbi:Uncharacterised protein at_DN2489 [Pycnogonum litorale]
MASRILIYIIEIIIALHSTPIPGIEAIDLGLGFLEEPQHITVLRGKSLMLNCSAFSGTEFGPHNITWQFEGHNINDGRRYVLPNGSLYFEKIVHQRRKNGNTDEGWYACVVRNDVGALISQLAKLQVANMARHFDTKPQPLTVHEGGVARFSCQISAVPDAVISWEKDRQPINSDNRITTIKFSGVLQINNVKKTDAGKYRCIATNMANQRRSSEAQLIVNKGPMSLSPPTFLSPDNQVIIKNVKETAILECLATGNVKPSLSWSREDGAALPDSRISQIGQGTLVISSLSPDDSGVYVCTASSKNPKTRKISSKSQSTKLQILVPPDIVVRPESVAKPMSLTARFKCNVEGTPTPNVIWLKNGNRLKINGRIKQKSNSVLIVAQTVTSDSGIYQCVASNKAGTSTAAARLHVNTSSDQPSEPQGLVAATVSSSSILVRWNASVSPPGLRIQAYSIHCYPTDGAGGNEIQKVTVNTSQLFSNLMPFTDYTFYVRAYNGRSASPHSKRVTQVTGEDVPIGAPSISITSTSPTSVHVSWQKLPNKVARGRIVAYKIYYRLDGVASQNVIDVVGNVYHYTISELESGSTYDIRVLAGTSLGFPALTDPQWPWVSHILPTYNSKQVPSAPNLKLQSINSSTVLVTWKNGAFLTLHGNYDGGEDDTIGSPSEIHNDTVNIGGGRSAVDGYKLSYRKQSHLLQGPFILSNTSRSYVLSNLDPHSWYEIHFIAFNNHGDGPETVRNIRTPSSDDSNSSSIVEQIVEPPTHLEALPMSKSSIKLTWQPPTMNVPTTIGYYTVSYYVVKSASEPVEPRFLRSTTNEVTITDLKPFTLYEFSVQSHNENNIHSPYSRKVQCFTKQDVPSPPTDISWKPINASAVKVRWRPPEHPNGIVIAYYVLYKSATPKSQEVDAWHSVTKHVKDDLIMNLTNLASNTFYHVALRAETEAGIGRTSAVITISIPAKRTNFVVGNSSIVSTDDGVEDTTNTLPDASNRTSPVNPSLGIIVGVSIGVACIVICVIIILCRSRCCPQTSHASSHGNVTYVMDASNGHHALTISSNGYIGNGKTCNHESREMDAYTPMLLTRVPDNDNPLDTKGGYPIKITASNRPSNGIGHHQLRSQCGDDVKIVNGGKHNHQKQHVNITENPQCVENAREENPTDEDDASMQRTPTKVRSVSDDCNARNRHNRTSSVTSDDKVHDNSSIPLLSSSTTTSGTKSQEKIDRRDEDT